MDYEKLTQDLSQARAYAIDIGTANTEDGGTCNFDTPVLIAKGCRKDKLEEVAKKAGVRIYKWEAGVYHISGDFLWGQGNLRTRMAQAFTKVLADMGYDAYTYYAMD